MKSRMFAVTVVLLLGGALLGCENIVTFTGQVRVAADVAPTVDGQILLIINDDYRYAAEDVEGMWGEQRGGLFVVEPYARWTDDEGYVGQVEYLSGTSDYEYWHEEFAYYPGEIWLGAFIDTNGNLLPDDGEAWGTFRSNPIEDRPRHAPPDDPIVVDLDVDRLWP